MSPIVWVCVGVLGALGTLARLHIDAILQRFTASVFPLGTLAINLSGAFALGLLTGGAISGTTLTLVGGAAIGAFTTFSTWVFESERLAEDGELTLAAVNVVVSLLVGFAAAAAGWQLGMLL